jgi:uncharacterized protein (TIGR03435 family)
MNSGFSDAPHGGMRARNVTTLQAVLFAWGIADYQLVGIPAWVRSERFEINFTPAEAETPISDSDLSSKTQAARDDRWFRQRQRL